MLVPELSVLFPFSSLVASVVFAHVLVLDLMFSSDWQWFSFFSSDYPFIKVVELGVYNGDLILHYGALLMEMVPWQSWRDAPSQGVGCGFSSENDLLSQNLFHQVFFPWSYSGTRWTSNLVFVFLDYFPTHFPPSQQTASPGTLRSGCLGQFLSSGVPPRVYKSLGCSLDS